MAVNAYLFDKRTVATHAALTEFLSGSINHAGPIEKVLAGVFLLRVEPIADNPSERVKNLKADTKTAKKKLGPVDKIVFGTGDRLGIKTITGDDTFVRAAAARGVILDVLGPPLCPLCWTVTDGRKPEDSEHGDEADTLVGYA